MQTGDIRLVLWRKPLASPGEGLHVGINNPSTREVEQYRARIEVVDGDGAWHAVPVVFSEDQIIAAARGVVQEKYRKTDYWRRLRSWWVWGRFNDK